jgi:SET domain-containing protein
MQKTRVFKQTPLIAVRRVKNKYGSRSRGVFALRDIEVGETIEEVPVIRMPNRDVWWNVPDEDLPTISHYVFAWHDDEKVYEEGVQVGGEGWTALALGYASIYNHSEKPNAEFKYIKEDALRFTAVKPIKKGEEITIHYYQFTGDKPKFPKWAPEQ